MPALRCYQSGKYENGKLIFNNFTLTECSSRDPSCRPDGECTHCLKVVGQEGIFLACEGEAHMKYLGLIKDGCIDANATKLGPTVQEDIEEYLGFHMKQICTCKRDACNRP